MGVFYMKHFIHGTKVAISEVEVEHDKSHGWVQYDLPVQITPMDLSLNEPVNALVKRPYNRKPKE